MTTREHLKVVNNQKLTKPQKEWYYKYVEFLKTNYSEVKDNERNL